MLRDGGRRPVKLEEVAALARRLDDRGEHPVIGAIDRLATGERAARHVFVGAAHIHERHAAAGELERLRGGLVLGIAAVGLRELAIPAVHVGLHAPTGAHHGHAAGLLVTGFRRDRKLRLHDARLRRHPFPARRCLQRIAAGGDREGAGVFRHGGLCCGFPRGSRRKRPGDEADDRTKPSGEAHGEAPVEGDGENRSAQVYQTAISPFQPAAIRAEAAARPFRRGRPSPFRGP